MPRGRGAGVRAVTLAEGLPWIRAQARRYAGLWPDVDAEELEGRVIDRWLLTGKRPSVRYVAIDVLRKAMRRKKPPLCVRAARARDPERDAQVLALRAQGLPWRAIGEALGIEEVSAQQLHRRAERRAEGRRVAARRRAA